MSNQGDLQAVIRGATGTALDYNGDWHALFDRSLIAVGPFDGRMLAWLNAQLGATYTSLPQAQQAMAASQGFYNWSAMNTVTLFALGKVVALDFTTNRFRVGLSGAPSNSFTALPGASFTNSTGGFAQTSAGTLQLFAANTPRATDQGFLGELASTNLQSWSQDFTNAAWTKTGVTAATNVATAPDGTTTANKLTEDTSTGQHAAFGNVSQTSGTTYTNAVFVKAAGRGFAMVRTSFSTPDSGFIVNLTTGAVSGAFGTLITASSVQPLANGWFRVSYTYINNNTRGSVVVGPALNATTFSYTGDGASGIFVWGAQLEQASVASSYIPTTSAAATRSADAASITYSPNGSSAAITFGTSGTASPSATSPINFGASSGGAWVGGYLKTLTVTP